LDAIQALYEAEAELEINVASAGRPRRVSAVLERRRELDGLLEMLTGAKLAPTAMVPEVKERIWTALRQRYLDAGAFEPAEEALAFIHAAQRERTGNQLPPRWMSALSVPERMAKKPITYLGTAFAKYWHGIVDGWNYVKSLIIFAPKSPLGTLVWWLLVGTLLCIGLFAPDFTYIHTKLVWVVPMSVLLALSLVWMRRWPRAALDPGTWISSAVLSVLVLSAGNLALLSNTSSPNILRDHRLMTWEQCLEWTCGCALMAQVMPSRFLYPDEVPKRADAGPGREPKECGFLQFGWQGQAPKEGLKAELGMSDLEANPATETWRTMLWLENIITGWLTFATGLSTLYRRASRG
jgi:hypothetical protein